MSAVAEHVWVYEHDIAFKSISVLVWEHDLHQHMSLESCNIYRNVEEL